MTRTWSQRSEVLEDEEVTVTSWADEAGDRATRGASRTVPARAIEAGRVVRCERMLIKSSLRNGWRWDSPWAECPSLKKDTDAPGEKFRNCSWLFLVTSGRAGTRMDAN